MKPSPFPGMDPFLEEPHRWGGVHSRLINSLSDYLSELVAPHFYVDIEEHVYLVTPDGDKEKSGIMPDVFLIQGVPTGALTATAGTITPPRIIEPLYETEVRVRYLEIRDTENHQVVTTLEVLSPFNKAKGTADRKAFLRKRNKVMASPVHWIEIDLLRSGERPADIAPEGDYYALLKRGDRVTRYELWYFDLPDIMPTIAVPLRPPFADVPLNLQTVFNTVYARGRYAYNLDYASRVPSPRLPAPVAVWVAERIRAWQAQD